MITIVKIGGNVIDNAAALSRFLDDFARLEGPKVLVHGGGKLATRLSERLGIETRMVEGRRITDKETLDVVTMVYAGLTNKNIVAALAARGVKAVGLSGADTGVIPATRRSPEPIDFGYVGDINPAEVNTNFIKTLLEAGVVPVFCALTHDGQGSLLNSNADSVASAVAIAASRISASRLVFCFEKPGVLLDVNDDNSVIPSINRTKYAELRAGQLIFEGMLPKIDGAFKAIDNGVKEVIIKRADSLLCTAGTTITE